MTHDPAADGLFFRDDEDWLIFTETARRFLLAAAGDETVPTMLADDFVAGAPLFANQLEALARLLREAVKMVEPEVKAS